MEFEEKLVLNEAARLRAAKDHAGAARLLEQALVDSPEQIDLRIEMVRALYAAGEVEAARKASRPLEDVAIDEASWKKLFGLFRAVRDDMRAQVVTLRLLKNHPKHDAASMELLKLLAEGKRGDEARKLIERLLMSPSLPAPALNLISECQARLRWFAEAAHTAQRGIDSDTTSFDCRMSLIKALHNMKKDSEIRRHIGPLPALAGGDARRWGWVAQAASWAGQSKLIEMADRSVSELPNVPDRVRMQIGRAYTTMRIYAPAIASLRQIAIAGCTDTDMLKSVLNCADELTKMNGFTRTVSEIGSASARRLIELSDPAYSKVHYAPKLSGYEGILSSGAESDAK